jgi:hypothetical protein
MISFSSSSYHPFFFPHCFATVAQPQFLVFEGFSLPACQFRVAAANSRVPAATVVAPVDRFEIVKRLTAQE